MTKLKPIEDEKVKAELKLELKELEDLYSYDSYIQVGRAARIVEIKKQLGTYKELRLDMSGTDKNNPHNLNQKKGE